MPKLSGATNCTAMAPSEPARPVNIALTAKVRVFSSEMLTPIASAASEWSRIAIIARPMRPRTMFQASTNNSTPTPSVNK